MPVEEAQDLVGKVREKKMGMLFENMEKMDIQEERRKTAEQRRRAEEAEQKAEEAEQKAEEATQKLKNSVRFFVESCQELGIEKVTIKDKLIFKFCMDGDSAERAIIKYWKEK